MRIGAAIILVHGNQGTEINATSSIRAKSKWERELINDSDFSNFQTRYPAIKKVDQAQILGATFSLSPLSIHAS